MEFITHIHLHIIVVGESAVLQNVVSELNNAMCVVRLATFQGYAVRDYRMLLEGMDMLQI